MSLLGSLPQDGGRKAGVEDADAHGLVPDSGEAVRLALRHMPAGKRGTIAHAAKPPDAVAMLPLRARAETAHRAAGYGTVALQPTGGEPALPGGSTLLNKERDLRVDAEVLDLVILDRGLE